MKITYSLQEYYDQTLALAKTVGKSYVSVTVVKSTHRDEFTTYIDGYGQTTGKTLYESFNLMRDKVAPSPLTTPETDVLFEMETDDKLNSANDVSVIS